ncbi:hypothetical protein [Vibrio mediterranei]|uniref:hypothetical protein n=1 Tax=Vibrio mediterranei TaxID=689 RepID=UPI001EFD40B7|nr:hypothetical protein [Vibrio mediterranei]MCG9658189.1 hypothetical protein [Vibrio mediterranei]
MSKLLKLKKFLTVEEAGKYLSSVLEEAVSVPDIYGFALDRHLTLSVKFNSVIEMSPGFEFEESKLPYNANETNSFVTGLGRRVFFEDSVMIGEGIFDLSMLGSEFMEVDALHKKSLGEIAWESSTIESIILKRNSFFYKLKGLESQIDEVSHVIPEGRALDSHEMRCDCRSLNYYSHKLIIRKEELDRFILSLNEENGLITTPIEEEKSLAAKERNSLLTLIVALCEQLKIDPLARGTAGVLQQATELSGSPLGKETIRQILLKIKQFQT